MTKPPYRLSMFDCQNRFSSHFTRATGLVTYVFYSNLCARAGWRRDTSAHGKKLSTEYSLLLSKRARGGSVLSEHPSLATYQYLHSSRGGKETSFDIGARAVPQHLVIPVVFKTLLCRLPWLSHKSSTSFKTSSSNPSNISTQSVITHHSRSSHAIIILQNQIKQPQSFSTIYTEIFFFDSYAAPSPLIPSLA